MSQQAIQENKMGTMPINRLLISMSLPMMISMLVQALYNIVDSIFVSRIPEGVSALAALSLAFPVQNLMIGVASGTGVGINALLSRSLGEKNSAEADRAANNGVFLVFCSCAVFMLLGLTCTRFFFEMQTQDPVIVECGVTYLSICSIVSFGMFGQVVFERLLLSTGKTMLNMITQGTGAIINIILDPILIFGWLGLPAMGVAGAAVATVIGQIVAMCLAIYFNIAYNREIRLSPRGFRPSGATIARIYKVGVPSMLLASVGSVMTFGMNRILIAFTDVATAVFGVYFKLQSFIFMPVFGLNNGMVPILSYNYGARSRERMVQTIRLSITYAVGIMLVGMVVFQIFPRQLLGIFNADEQMLQIGTVALRLISLSFLFAGFCIIVGSVFQALGNGLLSLIASVGRQLVALLPSAYLLSRLGNLDLVWLSFPIAEIVSVALNGYFLVHIYRKVIAPIPPAQTLQKGNRQ